MIYDLPSGYSIVFIPKNGSSSVKRALNWNYEKPSPAQKWHNILTIPDKDKGNLVALLRDPVERFLSCCSFMNWRNRYDFGVETYMAKHDNYPTKFMAWHFRRQIDFVQNLDWFAKLYYLSEMDEFFTDHNLGRLEHRNKTSITRKIEPSQKIIDFVHDKYKEDYELLASIKPKHRTL